MFDNYGIEIAQIFKKAEELRRSLKHPYVGSEHLLLALLKEENDVSKKLKTHGLTYKIFENELINVVGKSNKDTDFVLYTPLLKRIIEGATNDANENNDGKVTERHLFLAMLEEGEGIAIRILLGLNIDLDQIYEDLKFTLVGNKKIKPLLIVNEGVVKRQIIHHLPRRMESGLVPNELLGKTIVMLEMGALVSGTKYRGEFEERLTKIIKEVIENKNIILFIDEIHTMINAGGAEGAINAADILKPYLARGDIKVIGATTTEEYYNSIYKDKALERRFYAIQVSEPDLEKTKEILLGVKEEYESHHNLVISEENINDIVKYADKYIKTKSNPDKSLDLLDMICARQKVKKISFQELEQLNQRIEKLKKEKNIAIQNNDYDLAMRLKEQENLLNLQLEKKAKTKNTLITKKDILETLEKKVNVPMLENKKAIFLKIKTSLQKNILGQKSAIEKILQNIWIKLNENSKPCALLLNGPSGVGKTETVKCISESLEKSNFIRLDMSEYNLDTSVNKLLGVSAGYVGYEDAFIFRSVMDNPYSIILVDEIEKAHPRVMNLFLQIMDEGFITSAKGEKIDFSNTMIFMTSNVISNNKVGFTENENHTLTEYFSKEFLGRFTDIISFQPLADSILKEYTKMHLTNKNVKYEKIKKEAECDKYGLRNLKNLIKKYNCEIDIEIPL